MAHPKQGEVRARYAFSCGYCGVSETDTGGELTVDHFYPTYAGGDDSDDNLVYACFRCNLYKGMILPEKGDGTNTPRLLHPLRDNLAEHIGANLETGRLEGRTAEGIFHISALRLNRTALIASRKKRWKDAGLLARLDQALAENVAKSKRLERYEDAIRLLEERLKRIEEGESE